jgi:hypothetical protein
MDEVSVAPLGSEALPLSDADAALALYLLTPRCVMCGAVDTPQWRHGGFSRALGKKIPLCNACGMKWKKKTPCRHCETRLESGEERAICVVCGVWAHAKCADAYLHEKVRCFGHAKAGGIRN